MDDEFLNVGRLDNLGMSFCALTALVDTFASPDSLQGEACIKAVALFDHEEVGSSSAQGQGLPGLFVRYTISCISCLRLLSAWSNSLPACIGR